MPDTFDSSNQPDSSLIAPVWHTIVVVLILLGFSALGARSHSAFGARVHGRILGYVTAAAFEWLLLGFVWLGLRLRARTLGSLLGHRWSTWGRFFSDLGLAVLFLLGANIVLGILAFLLKAKPTQALRSLFPRNAAEVTAYLLLSLTAGICEELICRGYLQRQFTALTRSTLAGVLLQGIVFGAAHGYQGARYMAMISVYGCLFGALAHWRRSLLPGMTAHFFQDGILGLLLGLAQRRIGFF
jgi:membrane protease YdiL (CAAX protease family)